MAAILEIPEVRERLSPLSVEEYHRLGEYNEKGRRTELIRGFVIRSPGRPALAHRLRLTGTISIDLTSSGSPV